jgi:hypothetical protein
MHDETDARQAGDHNCSTLLKSLTILDELDAAAYAREQSASDGV